MFTEHLLNARHTAGPHGGGDGLGLGVAGTEHAVGWGRETQARVSLAPAGRRLVEGNDPPPAPGV